VSEPASGASGGFGHEALIYRGLSGLLDAVLPFVREGVGRGDPTLVALPGDRLGAVREALGDTADLVTFADMEIMGANPGRIIPAWADFLDAFGSRPVRGVGEPVWAGRSPTELEECRRHEALVNLAFAGGGPFTLLCAYDADALAPEVVATVGCSHPVLARDGVRGPSHSCASLSDMAAPHSDPLEGPPEQMVVLGFSSIDLSKVRWLVRAEAVRAGLSESAVESLVLGAHEVATNSIRHGGGTGTLRVWRSPRSVVVEVADAGHITDPLVGRCRPSLAASGGRGLWMAHQLCDLVQLRDVPAGTVVRLHQHLPVA
jgi:anti-sigma regulatory factor (Ser/Thr protein kinase)